MGPASAMDGPLNKNGQDFLIRGRRWILILNINFAH